MDPTWVPIMGIIAGIVIPVTISTVSQISKYKIRVEQIKADALVRAEEVKAKNQLEIEKLIYQNQAAQIPKENNGDRFNASSDEAHLERSARNRERI